MDLVSSISRLFVKLVTVFEFDMNRIDEFLELNQ